MFPKKTRLKYNNTKTKVFGIWFDSQLEKETYLMLLAMKQAGEVKEIECQVTIRLSEAKIGYRADFVITHHNGDREAVEAKGFETEVYRLKRKLYIHYGPFPLRVYKRGKKGTIYLAETIVPQLQTNLFTIDK